MNQHFLDPLAQLSVWFQSVVGPDALHALNQISEFLNRLAGNY